MARLCFLPLVLALAIWAALVLAPRLSRRRRQHPVTVARAQPVAEPIGSPTPLLPPLAVVRDDDIWTCDADGGHQRRIIRHGASPCWSPDHRQIAFARGGDIWLANADGSGQRQLTAMRGRYRHDDNSAIAWDPVEREVDFAGPVVHSTAGREVRKAMNAESFGSALLAVPPTARRWDRTAERIPGNSHIGPLCPDFDCPAWSRSGKHVAFAVEGDIWVATRGRLRFEGEADAGRYRREAGSWDKWEWEMARLAARAEYDCPNYRADAEIHFVTRLSWSPDERSLAYGIRRQGGSGFDEVHLLRLGATDESPIGLKILEDKLIADRGADPSFAPDGKLIALQAFEGELSGSPWSGVVVVSTDGMTRRRIAADGEQPAW